jgi:hypothetical protein
MIRSEQWNNRIKAAALGIGLALTALTIRHWYGTFMYGYPPCNDCRSDFPGFYAAARLVWEKPSALYDYAPQLAIQKAIDNRIGDSILPFAYPPITALVLMPLGWLSFRAAFVGMTLVNISLLLLILRLLVKKLELGRDQTAWLSLTAFCSFGVHSVLLQGQTSLLVFFCLTAFMISARDKKEVTAGLSAGLNFIKPQLLAVPFVVLAFQRFWRGLIIAGLVVTGLALLSAVLVGTRGSGEYIGLLKFYSTTPSGFGSYPEKMHNLRALVQYWVPFHVALYVWLALVVVIGLLTVWMNTLRNQDAQASAVLWIGNFLAMMLITPHLYSHDLVLLLIPSALVLKLAGSSIPWFVSAALISLSALPILPLVLDDGVPSPLPIFLLSGYCICVYLMRNFSQSAGSERVSLHPSSFEAE